MPTYRATPRRSRCLRAGWALLLLGLGGFAAAAEPGSLPAPADVVGFGQPVTTTALAELRGGDDTVENDIWVDGEVTNNSAEYVASGANIIDGGAFGNAAGVSTVIQNSGSNVLIQNAMIVNVQFGPPEL